jgi:hypothetical protein
MSNRQDITDLVNQLQRLQLQQSELLQRLTLASEENNNNTARAAQPTTNTPREFIVGDRVRITNPNRFQTRIGICRVTKIGPSQITVLAANGTKIHRAAKNLVLEE